MWYSLSTSGLQMFAIWGLFFTPICLSLPHTTVYRVIASPDQICLCVAPSFVFLASFFLSRATPLLRSTRYHSRIIHKSHPSGENLDSTYYRGTVSWLFRIGFYTLGGNPAGMLGKPLLEGAPSQWPPRSWVSNTERLYMGSRAKLQAFL